MSARPLCPVPSSLSPCPPTHSSRGLAAIAALIGNGGLIMGSVFAVFAPCIALVFPHLLKAHGTEARVRKAAARFRGIPWSALEEKHLCASRATPEEAAALSKATLPAELGDVDAFLSHSWSDDGHAKYAALSEWADDFTERNGRPPLLWFDKACIDQNDIENALVGLPVYVSGCHVLLILDGPTYPTRLWCIMEIFCFLTMGGNREDIVVLPVEASSPLEVPDSAGSLGSPLVCLGGRNTAFGRLDRRRTRPPTKGKPARRNWPSRKGSPRTSRSYACARPNRLQARPRDRSCRRRGTVPCTWERRLPLPCLRSFDAWRARRQRLLAPSVSPMHVALTNATESGWLLQSKPRMEKALPHSIRLRIELVGASGGKWV